jgi:carbonic anhydrase
MCEVNVGMQVRRLAATPIVEDAWARGAELHLHGWVYAVHDGLLRDIGPHLSSAVERDALPSIDDDAAIEGEPAAGP